MVQIPRKGQGAIPGESKSLPGSRHGQAGGHEKGTDAHEGPKDEGTGLSEGLVVDIGQGLSDGAVIDGGQVGAVRSRVISARRTTDVSAFTEGPPHGQ